MNLRRYVGVPEGSLDIVVDGVHMAVAHEGAGPPVVCVHAIGHGGGDYAAFASGLKSRFQVIRIDWPGHGRSGPDQCAVTPSF
jgi:4,5:9,10-diseco-3-hydroxy-5,9,17-trioxoandrosta-1(10),2-diene-4-oate hydrolase